jgi:hypothetical protein
MGAPATTQPTAIPVAQPVGVAPQKPPANQGFNLQEGLYNANSPTIPYAQAVLAAQQQQAAALAKQQQVASNQNGNGIWGDSYFNSMPVPQDQLLFNRIRALYDAAATNQNGNGIWGDSYFNTIPRQKRN